METSDTLHRQQQWAHFYYYVLVFARESGCAVKVNVSGLSKTPTFSKQPKASLFRWKQRHF
jgi:hypothetical protein